MANRAVPEAHYREHPEARPERWEIVDDLSPDEVLAFAVALATSGGRADNPVPVKELTDAEVASRFSAVLDGAENGEAIAITRDGRRIAMLVPAPRANGAATARATGRVPVTTDGTAGFGDLPEVSVRLLTP